MKINKIINQNYTTVSVLEDTRDILEWFKSMGHLAVADEEARIIGIITREDLIVQPDSRLVLDCNFIKPALTSDTTILEAQRLMTEAKTHILPVFDNDTFIGTISITDIAARLATIVGETQQTFQKVIHDVRNPLSNIQGLGMILSDNLQNDKENKELIDLSQLSCKNAFSILEDLWFLEIDENKPRNRSMTELNSFYDECIKELQGLCLLKHIALSVDLDKSAVTRNIDRGQIKRAIQNVFSNAVKFSHQNSNIKVSSEIKGADLILKIVDSGIGIPQYLQPYIFDKFTQARRLGTNGEATTGLGLCFSKQSIERHGGKISFKSEEGKGTKFYITL